MAHIAHLNLTAAWIAPSQARIRVSGETFSRLRAQAIRRRWVQSHFRAMARGASAFCAEAVATEEFNMRLRPKTGMAIVLLMYALTPSLSLAQATKDRTIEQYACKDVMRESGASRDVAIAFLRGFLLGKSGMTKFNIDTLHKQSDDFIERCLANPDEKAMDAMAKVIG
jgi:HdeA/HdeB family